MATKNNLPLETMDITPGAIEEAAEALEVDSAKKEALIETMRVKLGGLDEAIAAAAQATLERDAAVEQKLHAEKTAYRDALTRLPNRRLFDERLKAEIERAEREGSDIGMIYFDMDKFKLVNDNLGHDIGDIVLIELSKIIKASVRASDTVVRYSQEGEEPEISTPARLGGEEFAIILPNQGRLGTILVAERLRREVEEKLIGAVIAETTTHTPEKIKEHLRGTISVGVASSEDIKGEDGKIDGEILMKRADDALYVIKNEGRNGVAYWYPKASEGEGGPLVLNKARQKELVTQRINEIELQLATIKRKEAVFKELLDIATINIDQMEHGEEANSTLGEELDKLDSEAEKLVKELQSLSEKLGALTS